MNDITELAQRNELLIANGQQTAELLRHLADNEIDSDYFAVVSECESYGKETDAELSITEFALRAAGYVDALVEALEKAQAGEKQWREVVDAFCADDADWHKLTNSTNELISLLSQSLCKQADRIAELESEVKFPGVMRCNKCGFSRSHVIATPGGMRAGESTPARCPNGCGPLWHDTYRRQYNELYDAYKELESRTVTVKLPRPGFITISGERTAVYLKADVDAVLTAVGIKWEAE